MEEIHAGRLLMADSLGFHIIFVLFGIGLPLVVSIIEYMAIKRRDDKLLHTAKVWSFISSLLVITGVLSGSVVALQMFFVWPGIIEFGGSAIGLAFMLEGYAFLLEATFLALYVKTWDKIKGIKHWLLGIPVIIGSAGSAVLITAVDAWMNHPSGVTIVDGKVVAADQVQAIFNQTSLLQSLHSILGYYFVVFGVVSAVYAFKLIRKKNSAFGDARISKMLLNRFVILAALTLLAVGVMGDLSAKYLAKHEPTKLAAMELLRETQSGAPLLVGGLPQPDGTAKGGIEIPKMLSVLAHNNPNAEVKGLNETPRELWPPLVVHILFDIKMLLVGAASLIVVLFLFFKYKASKWHYSKPMLAAVVALPFIGVLMIELGWIMTEMGRQPFAVYGHVLTKDAMTTSQSVIALGWLFPTVYLLLTIATLASLRMLLRRLDAKPTKMATKTKKGGK